MIREYIIKVDEDKKDIMGDCPLVEKPREIVHCKDCKNRKEEWWNCPCRDWADDDFFCASGKPKEGETNG